MCHIASPSQGARALPPVCSDFHKFEQGLLHLDTLSVSLSFLVSSLLYSSLVTVRYESLKRSFPDGLISVSPCERQLNRLLLSTVLVDLQGLDDLLFENRLVLGLA